MAQATARPIARSDSSASPISHFDRAVSLDDQEGWIIARRGETFRQLDRCEEALADFDRAIALDPEDTWAISGRGETYRQMGRFLDAAEEKRIL